VSHNNRRRVSYLTVALLVVGLAVAVPASRLSPSVPTAASATQTRTPPPAELIPGGYVYSACSRPSGAFGEPGEFFVSAFIATSDRRVDVRTTYTAPAALPLPPLLAEQTAETEYSVRYWPNTAARLGDVDFLVGAQALNGNTVIEQWTFSRPSLDAAGKLVSGLRTGVVRHYDQYAVGRNLVQGMVVHRGVPSDAILVHFHDSKDLYSFDLASHQFSLVASPTPKPNALLVPELSSYVWETYSVSEHVSSGFVYLFRRRGEHFIEEGPFEEIVMLAIYDSDKNGTLDSAQALNTTSWQALGYGKSVNWLD
jgi:hypothetical protein